MVRKLCPTAFSTFGVVEEVSSFLCSGVSGILLVALDPILRELGDLRYVDE